MPPVVADLGQSLHHRPRDAGGVVDDHLVAGLCGRTQGRADETMNLFEIIRAVRRAGKDHREGQRLIGRIEKNAEQV